jgi:hypothetical protein
MHYLRVEKWAWTGLDMIFAHDAERGTRTPTQYTMPISFTTPPAKDQPDLPPPAVFGAAWRAALRWARWAASLARRFLSMGLRARIAWI